MENLNIQIQHKLIEELTNKNKDLKSINSFAESIQRCNDSLQVIETMGQTFKTYFSWDYLDIFLLRENSSEMINWSKTSSVNKTLILNKKDKSNQRVDDIINRVAKTGVPELKNSLDELNSSNADVNSEIAVPLLLNREKVIGVMYSKHRSHNFFNIEHQKMLVTIGSMAASKLVQTKHLEKIKNYQSQLEDYVHIVSHDLKSPLRSINALANWVKEDNYRTLEETSIKNIDLILSTVQHMEKLIVDVLAYSKLDYSTDEDKNVDLNQVVEEVVDTLCCPENISISVQNRMPIIRGDKIKFSQVFQNLIGNAILAIDKPQGKIEISSKTTESEYEFSVSDNGVGIEERYFEKIFQVFQSLDDEKKSSGVGLSIIKKIVTHYGGRIWLESEKTKGTTFYFTLPR